MITLRNIIAGKSFVRFQLRNSRESLATTSGTKRQVQWLPNSPLQHSLIERLLEDVKLAVTILLRFAVKGSNAALSQQHYGGYLYKIRRSTALYLLMRCRVLTITSSQSLRILSLGILRESGSRLTRDRTTMIYS